MPRRQESLLEDLIYMHWSVSVALSGDCIRRTGSGTPAILCWRFLRPRISPACVHAPYIRAVCRAIAADSRRTLRVTSPENAPVT